MMFSYAGIEIKETRYAWAGAGDWFGKDKPRLAEKNSLANLPSVVDEGRVVTQSNAVLLYVGRKCGVAGSSDDQRTDVEQILCDAYDLRDHFVQLAYWFKGVTRTVAEFEVAKEKYLADKATGFFDKWEKWLSQGVACYPGVPDSNLANREFFCGMDPTAADFHAWELVDQHEIFAKDIGQPSLLANAEVDQVGALGTRSVLATRPLLKAWYDRFRALDKLQGYFASEAYQLPCNVPEFSFWSGAKSEIPKDAPQ